MLRLTLRAVRGHWGRFLLTATAVMLGTALIAGTYVLTDSIDDTFNSIFSKSATGLDVQVRGTAGTGSADGGTLRRPVPLTLVDSLTSVAGVHRASADLEGSIILTRADGTALRFAGAPTLGLAYRPADSASRITTGRAPIGPGEVLVERKTLSRSGLKIGDTTKAVIQGRPVDVKIVGQVELSTPLSGATVVEVDETTARSVFAPQGTVATISVSAEPGISQEVLAARIRRVLPSGAEAVTERAVTAAGQAEMKKQLGFISTFLLVFALISVFVGCFIIANTFSMLVARRTGELALLRAVGAGRGQVFRMILGEAVVVGVVGGAAGLAAGVGLAGALQTFFASIGMDLAAMSVRPRTALVTIGVGLVVTLASAVLPALRASSVPPMAALSQDRSVPVRSLRVRGVLGAATLGGSVLVVAWAVSRSAVNWWAFGSAAVAAVLGLVMVAPMAARPLVRLIAAPLSRSIVGRLARENTIRVPRRTAATAAALMVGLALISGTSVVAQSMKASVSDIIGQQLKAGFVVSAGQGGVSSEVAPKIAVLDGVQSVAALGYVELVVDGASIAATAVEPDALAKAVDIRVTSGSLGTLSAGQILISTKLAASRHWRVGDTLTAKAGTSDPRRMTIGGLFTETQLLGGPAVVPLSLYREVVPEAQRSDLIDYVNLAPGADRSAVQSALIALAKPYAVLSVQSGSEWTQSEADQVNTMLNILYALLALSVLIAVLGIVNTLAMSVLERTREIGLLRAVGLSRGQLTSMITVESVATALFGALMGTGLGLGLGVGLQHGLRAEGLQSLAVPWGSISLMILAAAFAGVVAAVAPAVKAARMDVLAAIAID